MARAGIEPLKELHTTGNKRGIAAPPQCLRPNMDLKITTIPRPKKGRNDFVERNQTISGQNAVVLMPRRPARIGNLDQCHERGEFRYPGDQTWFLPEMINVEDQPDCRMPGRVDDLQRVVRGLLKCPPASQRGMHGQQAKAHAALGGFIGHGEQTVANQSLGVTSGVTRPGSADHHQRFGLEGRGAANGGTGIINGFVETEPVRTGEGTRP